MSITIVVPVYKIEEEFLRKCLDSIKNQTDGNWTAILVDDGSPDRCGEICEEYSAVDRRFRTIHQENRGVSVARNCGIDETETEWVTFVDPDDWIELHTVEILNNSLEHCNADILAFGYAREFKNVSKAEYLAENSGIITDELLYRMRLAPLNRLIIDGRVYPYTVNAIWNKVYRVEFLNKYRIRFAPEARKGQDRIFNLDALDKAKQVFYLNALLYHYRNDNENSIVNRYNPNTIKNAKIASGLMRQWITDNNKGREYADMLNCWICTRIQEFMRLYYFHEQKKDSYGKIKKEISQLLAEEPYSSVLKSVNWSILTMEEKIFIFFVQRRSFLICKYMIRGREWLKKVKNRG